MSGRIYSARQHAISTTTQKENETANYVKRYSVCVARLLGQGRIVVSADVVIFRGISFSLAVSRCGVSTMQNPVAIANRYRLQPVAIDS